MSNEVKTKICIKCGKELPITSEYFHVAKGNKDGFCNTCKKCASKYKKQYQQKNKEAIAKRKHQHYEEHKEYINKRNNEYNKNNREAMNKYKNLWKKEHKESVDITNRKWRELHPEYKKEYYLNNKEKIDKQNKQWYEEHREETLEYKKIYYKGHKKVLLDHSKRWRKLREQDEEYVKRENKRKKKYWIENRDKVLESQKKYREKNKDKIRERVKRWRLNNKEKVLNIVQRRRTKKHQLPANLTNEQWEQIKQYFNNKCCYCGRELPLEKEHYIPLSKGGEYTVNNIIPACKSCNSSKNNKDFFKWYPKQKCYSKTREKKILEFLGYKNNKQQLSFII